MNDASGSTSWSYDLRGRMSQESKTIAGQTFFTSWTYNVADMPATMTYPGPDAETVKYSYNARMLLDSLSGSLSYISRTDYDTAGRMTSRSLGNGLTQHYNYFGWDGTNYYRGSRPHRTAQLIA